MRIIDKIRKAIDEKRTTFSFEYFAPKTPEGVKNLYDRLERMAQTLPAWIDVTWGAGGSTSALTLEICKTAQNNVGLETMMHLTCTNLPKENVADALKKAKEAGVTNILALRGDPPVGQQWKQIDGGFAHAVDLVRFIRAQYGNYFGICVAGYPEAHIEATSYEADLQYLKEKVDAGADFIITQLFYDVDVLVKFVADCRAKGITVPIIPGLMPIHTYAGFQRMTTMSKTRVPPAIRAALEPIKDNDEAVKAYGVELCVEMCRKLLELGVPGLHFYTLNLEKSVLAIVEALGLHEGAQLRKQLPYRTARRQEDVRPIFWHNRPKSYLARTASWDEFPNGRWGDSRSPAFGDLSDYHLMTLHWDASLDPKQLWNTAAVSREQDVWALFTRYIDGQLPRLPWSEQALALETGPIKAQLLRLNAHGFLTINSQPRVNAAPSDHPVHGWGGPGGYVYQKAYLEFFTDAGRLERLIALMQQRFRSLSFMAVNARGETYGNFDGTVAVTWGVFPGREVLQPTIVESNSFLVWKEEAYALWHSQWVQPLEEASPARQVFSRMHDQYYLVSLVDNDFIHGDLFAIFEQLIGDAGAAATAPLAAEDPDHLHKHHHGHHHHHHGHTHHNKSPNKAHGTDTNGHHHHHHHNGSGPSPAAVPADPNTALAGTNAKTCQQ